MDDGGMMWWQTTGKWTEERIHNESAKETDARKTEAANDGIEEVGTQQVRRIPVF
jgi:hypothetical protein